MEMQDVAALSEFFMESSSSSEEDEEFVEILCNVAAVLSRRKRRPKLGLYCDQIVGSYSRLEFVRQFRIGQTLCFDLVARFEASRHFPRKTRQGGGNLPIPAKKHILAFLWYIGHQAATFRDIVAQFDLAKDSFMHILSRVNLFLFEISTEAIAWPSNSDLRKNMEEFYNSSSMPNVIGCIDNMHVGIEVPKHRPDAYRNKLHVHSIQLQAITNYAGKFMDVFIGYPGSVNQTWILKNSFIYDKLSDLCKDGYLLGKYSYPPKTWLLTPYADDGNLSQVQKNYNEGHGRASAVIKSAFAMLRRRAPILWSVNLHREAEISRIILSCCVLHNLADANDLDLLAENDDHDYYKGRDNRLAEDIEEDSDGLDEARNDEEPTGLPTPGTLSHDANKTYGDALRIRDAIARELKLVT